MGVGPSPGTPNVGGGGSKGLVNLFHGGLALESKIYTYQQHYATLTHVLNN